MATTESGTRPEKIDPAQLRFTDELRAYHHRQRDLTLMAFVGDKPVGGIDYSIFGGQVFINWIETAPGMLRRGVGTALYRKLKEVTGGDTNEPIYWGLLVDDVAAQFYDAVIGKRGH